MMISRPGVGLALFRPDPAGNDRGMRRWILISCLLTGLAVPARAEVPVPPYDAQLLRLSELLGALHYLRGLCQAADAPAWRAKMNALIASEGIDEAGRARYAGAFNRGYRTFRLTYRTCNNAATDTVKAYLDEGGKIARDLHSRYAN